MKSSEVGGSQAATVSPAMQKLASKDDSGIPVDVFAAVLGMAMPSFAQHAAVHNPGPPVARGHQAVPVSAETLPGENVPAERKLSAQSGVVRALATKSARESVPNTQQASAAQQQINVQQGHTALKSEARRAVQQAWTVVAGGEAQPAVRSERTNGPEFHAMSETVSPNTVMLQQPSVTKSVKQAPSTTGTEAPGGMPNTKGTGLSQLPIALARDGIPITDVRSVSFMKHGVQSDKPTVSTEAWRIQHGKDGAPELPGKLPKDSTSIPASLSVSGHHVQPIGTGPQGSTASGQPAEWSMLNADAHRQFAALITQHIARPDTGATLTVQVHPQGLGSITVTVAQQTNGLSVQIQATNMQTAQWLQSETQRLTQAVQMSGIPVAGLQVGLPDANPGDSQSQNSGADRKNQSFSGRKGVTSVNTGLSAAPSHGADLTAQSISVRV